MRKARELRRRLLKGVSTLGMAFGLFLVVFSMTAFISYAAAQAKVISPSGAKIRKEASVESEMIGGAEKDKILEVLSQVQGSDGNTWYQIKNGSVTGYVRYDLVEVTGEIGGGEPAGEGGEGGGEGGGDASGAPIDVIAVNPVGATVGGEAVEIRASASMDGQVLGTVPDQTAITVSGYTPDATGVIWYQASYIDGEAQVDGFIISDYVALSEELVPVGQEPAPEETPEQPPQQEQKRYDTVLNNGEWLLVDYETDASKGYPVEKLLSSVGDNAQLYQESEAKVKNQKIIIIVLIFLLVGAVAGIAFLVFKIRDMADSAYYSEVENETLKRKNASKSQGGSQKVMHTVGTEKPASRTAGISQTTRLVGGASQSPRRTTVSPDQRTSAGTQGTRTAGTSQRPVGTSGQRPAGSPQGQRPVGASGQRPVGSAQGTRTAGTSQGQRPVGSLGQRPAGGMQGQRSAAPGQTARRPEGQAPQGARPVQPKPSAPSKPQPKNFMADGDEDEFEFEFLNYDGDDEQ